MTVLSNTAGNLVSLLFLARDLTHTEHLKTRSYAAHVALNTFYDDIIPLADTFAETYQGMNGIIANIPLAQASNGAIVEVLQQHATWIENNRDAFNLPKEKPLQNIIDEVLTLYYQTIYKLRTFA